MIHLRKTLAFVVLILLHVGCTGGPSNPKTYPVSGVVTQGGKPVENASVVFVPLNASCQPAMGTTDANGKYELTTTVAKDGAMPGKYGVKVAKYDKPVERPVEEVRDMSPEEEQKRYNPDEKAPPPPKNLLPAKFDNHVTSGFSHTVGTEPSTYDIQIK